MEKTDFRKMMAEIVEKHDKEVKERNEYNMKILDYIKNRLERYPEVRFCQLLYVLGLTGKDNFAEEPTETYRKLVEFDKNEKL